MVLARENNKLSLYPVGFYRGVIPFGLPEWTPQVIGRMHDERRRGHLVRDGLRALASDQCFIHARVLLAEETADVRGSDERRRVEEPSLDYRSGEPVIVCNGPRGEVSTVRATEYSGSRSVDRWMLGHGTL
jgi:hypothetical protein